MTVADFFTSDIGLELVKQLFTISKKSCSCKSTAEDLKKLSDDLLPIVQEIKYSGVELPHHRQYHLDRLSEALVEAKELSVKGLASTRWNLYKNLQLTRNMEKQVKKINKFLNFILPAHVLADLHHLRFENAERFDRMESRLQCSIPGGGGGWMVPGAAPGPVEHSGVVVGVEKWKLGDGGAQITPPTGVVVGFDKWPEVGAPGGGENLAVFGLDLGKKKVRDMLMKKEENLVVGISGIGGSGKTTLASHICKDEEIRGYFKNRVLFLTVSQSPNVELLKATIWRFLSGTDGFSANCVVPEWNLQYNWQVGTQQSLVVLDDVWSVSVLKQLIFKVPGCKTLVVSRFKFPIVINSTYEMESLREDEAISLFCHYAFGEKSIPSSANESLVKQIVSECKALPLALKVVGSSLPHQPELYWASASKRLSRSEPICETHESELLERLATTIQYLPKKVRECFLDLGSFPEDKKIPLDVLVNMWVEIHDIDKDEAYNILVDLSEKNLLTLVKDSRAGEMYSSFYDVSITQHDVLRDLAIYMSNRGDVNQRKRLLMPKRESALPKEWERNSDQPFNAQVVSIHIDEMKEMDWFKMEFPKAEVLIINFCSNQLFLPPFINNMPRLRALVVINNSSANATLGNLSVFSNLTNLTSLWLEKVSVAKLNHSTIPLKSLRKISLILCKVNNSLDKSVVDLPHIFPCLTELTIDHCDDLAELPSSITQMSSLSCLSVTNCHSLHKIPADLGEVKTLEILRLYACPELKVLPASICELPNLRYLDISQCVNLKYLPEGIGKLKMLEKIDMRECSAIWDIPKSASALQSIRRVICDDEVSLQWKDLQSAIPSLNVQVAEKSFTLDWLYD